MSMNEIPGAPSLTRLILCFSLALTAAAQSSFWPNSPTPGTRNVTNDSASVTLGLRFTPTANGTVTAVRFYKGSYNTGTHVGTLWTSTGTRLASVTFTNETASGWQSANFTTPVTVTANTTYVVSYFAPRGNYADDQWFNWSALSTSPLKIAGSSPGVFAYGSSSLFPSSTWNRSNYWVDLVFQPSTVVSPPPLTPTASSISGTVTGTYSAMLSLSGAARASISTSSGGTYTFGGLLDGAYTVTPSASGFTFLPATANVTVQGTNVSGINFSASPVALPAPSAHGVTLNWNASASAGVTGYRVYVATAAGGPYTLLTQSLVTGTSYTDASVAAGKTYYYVVTAVDGSNVESTYSNEAVAVVPSP